MTNATRIGQYRILRKIGAGGMGTVFLAEHVLLKRRAAIKTLLPALSVHPEIVERFFNEARATSAIVDPGVVQIFDFGYHVDGTAYIVMELLEGESLAARIDRLNSLPVVDALRIARQVAGSLAAAHAQDIIHRDLKPENIYLIRDAETAGGERTKILDFGVCKVSDGDAELTQTDTMLGTPVYMSPEQCRGAGRADHRSDLYALGCVLFHMITSRPPFECDGVGEFMAAHLREDPPVASMLAPLLPPDVDAIIARCLAKDPADRFQSMTELRVAIEDALAHISDAGLVIPAAAPAVPLPTGFRSEYDASVGIPVPEPSEPSEAPPYPRAAHRLTRPATPVPVPDDLPDLPDEIPDELFYDEDVAPRRARNSMAVILAIAAVVAIVGIDLALTSGEPIQVALESDSSAPGQSGAPDLFATSEASNLSADESAASASSGVPGSSGVTTLLGLSELQDGSGSSDASVSDDKSGSDRAGASETGQAEASAQRDASTSEPARRRAAARERTVAKQTKAPPARRVPPPPMVTKPEPAPATAAAAIPVTQLQPAAAVRPQQPAPSSTEDLYDTR